MDLCVYVHLKNLPWQVDCFGLPHSPSLTGPLPLFYETIPYTHSGRERLRIGLAFWVRKSIARAAPEWWLFWTAFAEMMQFFVPARKVLRRKGADLMVCPCGASGSDEVGTKKGSFANDVQS